MSSTTFNNIFRFLVLLFFQVLVLKRFTLGWGGQLYFHVLLYPLFILLLPLRIPRAALLLLAFLLGICVDIFYDSPGVHASASVFTAYIRPFVLNRLEPRGGYNINHSPTRKRLGMNWFLRYAAIMMIAHLFFYFSVEAFTFVYIADILLKTISSWLISLLFIVMVMLVFNPLD